MTTPIREYRQPVSRYWWAKRRSYLLFMLREISCVFVAWSVVYLLLLVHAIGAGRDSYARFLDWSANPLVVALNLVTLIFVLLHAVTWFASAPRAIVRAAAGALAQKAPTVDAKVVNAAATDGQVVSKRLQNYLQSDAPNPELYWTEQPALAELRVANERLSAHELRTRQVRAAAIELAAESIAEIVPKAETELIKAFVQELTSTLSSKALHSVEHIPVGDLASAKRWVRTYLTGKPAAEKGAIAEAWAFYPSGLERSAGSGGARTAEVAISSLVGRLETQEIARQKFDWPRGFPNEVRPSFHPPRGPTIRVRP